jgi:TolB-like protein
VAAVVLVAGALTWVLGHRAERQTGSQSAPTPVTESPLDSTAPRLAVLPFTNLSPEPANAFFTDGLHEETISTLAERIPGIAVISRTTMMSFRQNPKPLGEVAQELGATHVMEGTVRREGNQVRLTLQLVDAGTDRYIWSQTYDRALASAMTLQSEVAADVATQMSVRLAGDATGMKPITRDAEAYDLYLRALLSFRELNFHDDSQNHALEDVLNRALARDPSFAQAYAQRARLHTLLFISGMDTNDRNYRSISADLAAAQRMAPNDPIVRAAFGYFMLVVGQFSRSLEAIESAEAAGLRTPEWLIPKTRALLSLGRVDDAIKVHEQMLSVDPANPLVLQFTAHHMLLLQRPEMSLRVTRLAAETFPDLANYFRGYVLLAARGDLQALHEAVAPILADSDLSAPQLRDPFIVGTNFEVLRFEHRYPELVEFLRRVPAPSLPFNGDFNEVFDSVGERPTAEKLGWAYLLLDQRALARDQGKAVLAFVAGQGETRLNRFYLRLLAAAGYTFTGQKQEAITAARAGLALMPRSENAVAWVGAAAQGARVYAWNGEDDEAVKLLEALAGAAPGMQPGFIARDPLFTIPLAKNAGFQSFVAMLEEQMRNARL